MYDNWEVDADTKLQDMKDGWVRLQADLAEDESWAIAQYEAFHAQEY